MMSYKNSLVFDTLLCCIASSNGRSPFLGIPIISFHYSPIGYCRGLSGGKFPFITLPSVIVGG